MIGGIGPDHVRQEDGDWGSLQQALSRFQPVGGVIARGPIHERSLELLSEVPQGQPPPIVERFALAFRLTQQLDVKHGQPRL